MIYSVRGKLTHTGPGLAVVDCGGVGYACKTTDATRSALPRPGGDVLLYTYLHLTENDISLFGFASLEELDCFKLIITVSGVGPKVGLAILSELSPDKLALAVAAGDYKALTRCPGVGNKLAQRLVLELKDKLALGAGGQGVTEAFSSSGEIGPGSLGEAIGALTALGYTRSEAASALSKLDQSLPVEELVKGGLRALSKRS